MDNDAAPSARHHTHLPPPRYVEIVCLKGAPIGLYHVEAIGIPHQSLIERLGQPCLSPLLFAAPAELLYSSDAVPPARRTSKRTGRRPRDARAEVGDHAGTGADGGDDAGTGADGGDHSGGSEADEQDAVGIAWPGEEGGDEEEQEDEEDEEQEEEEEEEGRLEYEQQEVGGEEGDEEQDERNLDGVFEPQSWGASPLNAQQWRRVGRGEGGGEGGGRPATRAGGARPSANPAATRPQTRGGARPATAGGQRPAAPGSRGGGTSLVGPGNRDGRGATAQETPPPPPPNQALGRAKLRARAAARPRVEGWGDEGGHKNQRSPYAPPSRAPLRDALGNRVRQGRA